MEVFTFLSIAFLSKTTSTIFHVVRKKSTEIFFIA